LAFTRRGDGPWGILTCWVIAPSVLRNGGVLDWMGHFAVRERIGGGFFGKMGGLFPPMWTGKKLLSLRQWGPATNSIGGTAVHRVLSIQKMEC